MTPPEENGSRRQIDRLIISRLDRFEKKLDEYQLKTEHRMTKLETFATIRGMIGGAITSVLTVIAGVLLYLWKGG